MKRVLPSLFLAAFSLPAIAMNECQSGSEAVRTPMPCDQYFALFPPKAPPVTPSPTRVWQEKREAREQAKKRELEREMEQAAKREGERLERERDNEQFQRSGFVIDRVYSPVNGYLAVVVKAKYKMALTCHALDGDIYIGSGRYVIKPPVTEITMHIGDGAHATAARCNKPL